MQNYLLISSVPIKDFWFNISDRSEMHLKYRLFIVSNGQNDHYIRNREHLHRIVQ